MCGIVGFVTLDKRFNSKRADYFEQALYADALRGMHSTGVFTLETGFKGFYMKDRVDAGRFLDNAGHRRFVRSVGDMGTKVAIGHNRFATMGGKGTESAHPFITENVTMVHNGTLRGAWRRDFPEHPDADVDSARIAQALSEAKPGGKSVLEKVEGAYCFVWYDHRNKSVHIARNEERPMETCIIGETMYFGSEGRMVEWLLSDDRLKIHSKPKATMLKPHTIYRWQMDDAKMKLNKPRVVKYTPYAPPAYVAPNPQRWQQGNNGGAGASSSGTTPSKDTTLTEKEQAKIDTLNNDLQELMLDTKYGDILEVQAGELVSYKEGAAIGSTLGWFDAVDLEGIDDNFDGTLYADVHAVPFLSVEEINQGNWHDSYYASVAGISDDKPEWMGKNDVLLTTVFQEVAARTTPRISPWCNEALNEQFGMTRQKYQVNDTPRHECGKDKLTNKELDIMTAGTKCAGCSIPAQMVTRSDISLDSDCKTWECLDCAVKSLDKELMQKMA